MIALREDAVGSKLLPHPTPALPAASPDSTQLHILQLCRMRFPKPSQLIPEMAWEGVCHQLCTEMGQLGVGIWLEVVLY